MVARAVERPEAPQPRVYARTADRGFTLEDLWETAPNRSARV
jgi:hypothetical protein